MTTQLIRHRRKPYFGPPWLALILGIGTLVFGGVGYTAVTAQPSASVEIIVQGEHPWNISQASVDALTEDPIRAWKPLRIMVTDRLLSYQEWQGQQDPGADVILSTAIIDDFRDFGPDAGFAAAGIYPAGPDPQGNAAKGSQIHKAYLANLGLGHGPAAVTAAAARAAEVLDEGPIRTPVFWVAGTATGLLLTVLALAFSLPRRMRRESLFRRLTAAQRQLARVVLDLEALEVTYQATDRAKRPAGFTSAWKQVRDASLELARTEEAVIGAVYSARSSLTPHTATLVAEFEVEAQRLTAQADALLGAGSVLGRLAGSERTLDRLAAPLGFATRELLARLDAAPFGSVPRKQHRALEAALASLLTAGARTADSTRAITAWENAERKLARSAAAVNRSLRRTRKGQVGAPAYDRADSAELRAGLGLSPDGSRRALDALDEANAAARALFGPLPKTRGIREPTGILRHRTWHAPRLRHPVAWLCVGVGVAAASLLAGVVASERLAPAPPWTLTGTQALHSLAIDGDLPVITEAGIRSELDDKFTERVDLVLAVRDAEEDLGVEVEAEPNKARPGQRIDPTVLLDSLWKTKAEFPQLLNPSTGELLPHHAIIPVWTFDDGTVTLPAMITGAVAHGNGRLTDSTWKHGTYYVSKHPDLAVSSSIEALSRGLQENGYTKPDINATLLQWLLTLTVALGLTTLVLVLVYGGAVSMRLGRFGRNAAMLRRIRRELEAMALGLDDSRLNTVAVLGAGSASTSAEADQRIYERALAVAWRMAEDLAAVPLSRRLGAGYLARIDRLGDLVARLGIRDAEAARRTRALLDPDLKHDPRYAVHRP